MTITVVAGAVVKAVTDRAEVSGCPASQTAFMIADSSGPRPGTGLFTAGLLIAA